MPRPLAALLFLPLGCIPSVDYSGTQYRCFDGMTCPEGGECIDEYCVLDPGPLPMVTIPESTFTMGCDANQTGCEENAAPRHPVTVSEFQIDATEVNQVDYWRCVVAGACTEPVQFDPGRRPFVPATHVNWDEALAYCNWKEKRLPSEAEWELAARGEEGTTYPWGEAAPDCDLAQYADCAPRQTVPVGQPVGDSSAFGLLGMAGNVAEWVADWYDENYYADSPERDPTGPGPSEDITERVVRGASFNDDAEELATWKREGDLPTDLDDDTGFRCAL
jgi:formylglycine-generating enzyme required for sulfatase activity